MTTTEPAPMPLAQHAVPASGRAPRSAAAAVQAGSAPARERRLSPGQVWTLVVAGVIAVVALVVGLGASGSDSPSPEEQLRDALYGGYSDYYGGSDCDSVFC